MADDDEKLTEYSEDYDRLRAQKARNVGSVELRILTNLSFISGEHWIGSQNRVIFTAQDLTQGELAEASNRLNAGYAGLTLEAVRERLRHEVDALRGEIAGLMSAAVQVGSEAMEQQEERVVVSGERNLLTVQDFSHDMGSLRRLFDLFEQKTQLMRLLDTSSRAEGVRIYIGGESQVVPYEELSIVSAPYEVDGQVVGTLGVIGPTRMAYDRMIQIVDITSRMVGQALSQR